jgi:hypothetical protein
MNHRSKICAVLFGAIAALLVSQPAISSGQLIEPVDRAMVYSGCGCMFGPPPPGTEANATVFFSSNYDGAARVKVGGNVVTLTAAKPDSKCSPSEVGGRCTLDYRGDNLRVILKLRATWVCPANDESESCEVVRLRGQLSAKSEQGEQVVDVEGSCGC